MAKLSIGQDTLRRKKMNNRKRVISNMKIKYIEHKERMSSLNCEDKVPMIRFDALEEFPFIRHGFSTRLGGISSGIYASMNLSFNRGDDDQKVMKNYELIAEELGTSTTRMVAAKQTHTTNVLKVGSDRCGMGITEKRDFDDIDGLITNEPGVCLVTGSCRLRSIVLCGSCQKMYWSVSFRMAWYGWKDRCQYGKENAGKLRKQSGRSNRCYWT